ncbi:MAG: hypothetical protein WAV85_04205 [Rhodoferax sp.]
MCGLSGVALTVGWLGLGAWHNQAERIGHTLSLFGRLLKGFL